MKTVTITVPVVGFYSTSIEVEDHWTKQDVIRAIRDDDLEVEFNPRDASALTPYLSMDNAIDDLRSGWCEIPYDIEVEDDD